MNNPTTAKAPAWAVRAAERIIDEQIQDEEPSEWSWTDFARIIAEEAAPLTEAAEAAIPLLVRLGDFIGNGTPTGPDSLGNRCDTIGKLRAALTT